MKPQQAFNLLLAAIAAILFCVMAPDPTLAVGNQSNQELNRPAMLIAPKPSFKINVYPKPGTEKRRVGFGLGGDRVVVVEQVGSNEGFLWNYVRFEKPPQLEGWVKQEFISFELPSDRAQKKSGRQSQERAQSGNSTRGQSQPSPVKQQPYNYRQSS